MVVKKKSVLFQLLIPSTSLSVISQAPSAIRRKHKRCGACAFNSIYSFVNLCVFFVYFVVKSPINWMHPLQINTTVLLHSINFFLYVFFASSVAAEFYKSKPLLKSPTSHFFPTQATTI
jgi:hypothetical protein